MFGFGSIKSGPILEHPLIEHNAERYTRPVWMKVRKVKGKRGWLLRRIGRFTAPDPTPEGLGHHAIQIGAYAYELHTDEANQKYLLVQRLSGSQIWAPTVSETVVGYCSLTDEEIAIQGWSHCYTLAATELVSTNNSESDASPIVDERQARWQVPRQTQ